MFSSFDKKAYNFNSQEKNKTNSSQGDLDALDDRRELLESQIDLDNFDPILSLKIDQIIVQSESRKSTYNMWDVGDP